MIEKPEMSFEEMAQLVDEARMADYYFDRHEQRKWEIEQRNKATSFVTQLEKHLPPELWQEILEFSEVVYGAKCIGHALRERSGHTDSLADDCPF